MARLGRSTPSRPITWVRRIEDFSLPVSDTGTATDSVATLNRTLADTASAVEAYTLVILGSETPSGVEAVTSRSLSSAETATGVDDGGIGQLPVTGSDSGSGTESGTISFLFTAADTGSGAEGYVLTVRDDDPATGVEDVIARALGTNDPATGAEAASAGVDTVDPDGPDTAVGVEAALSIGLPVFDLSFAFDDAIIDLIRNDPASGVEFAGPYGPFDDDVADGEEQTPLLNLRDSESAVADEGATGPAGGVVTSADTATSVTGFTLTVARPAADTATISDAANFLESGTPNSRKIKVPAEVRAKHVKVEKRVAKIPAEMDSTSPAFEDRGVDV